jgi:hypothetical protein
MAANSKHSKRMRRRLRVIIKVWPWVANPNPSTQMPAQTEASVYHMDISANFLQFNQALALITTATL